MIEAVELVRDSSSCRLSFSSPAQVRPAGERAKRASTSFKYEYSKQVRAGLVYRRVSAMGSMRSRGDFHGWANGRKGTLSAVFQACFIGGSQAETNIPANCVSAKWRVRV